MNAGRQFAISSRQHQLPIARRLLFAVFPLLAAFWLLLFTAKAAGQDGRWALLIVGASGDAELQNLYLKEVTDLYSILAGALGFPRDQIIVLFDDPSKNPDLIRHTATRENLQLVCHDLASRVRKDDLVFVFIEGHGDYDGKIYKLQLVGPDPTADELAAMLYSIPAQHFVIINATNCSGGSIPALSQEGKVVISATKSGFEKNLTHIGQFFIEAFKDNAADSDKNGRVSILEAFTYASRKVEEYYTNEGDLPTEHPVLDDNGDAQAQSKPAPENGEGLLARTTYLDSGAPAIAQGKMTPEEQELAREARIVEDQIEALKYSKGEMPEAEYEKKLEELLLRLARINAKMRKNK